MKIRDLKVTEIKLLKQRHIAIRLHQDGYVLLPRWRQDETTIAIGRSIGSIVDVKALLPLGNIPTVQTLTPCRKSSTPKSRYSGIYGLGEFPLHTDLAHWAVPPRYLMLRCQKGAQTTATRLLESTALASAAGTATLRQALVRPRRTLRALPSDILSILPLSFCMGGVSGVRWDSTFLVPMNEAASQIAGIMQNKTWCSSKGMSLTLTERGDTLLLDNWRFLHGRSSISAKDIGRRLDRIYLSEVYA